MNYKRKNLILISYIFLYLILCKNLLSQTKPEFNYGVQADITSVLVVNTFGGSIDIDITSFNKENPAYVGIRLGVEKYFKNNISFDVGGGGGGGPMAGSPFTDIDFLGRFTLSGKLLDLNLCPGLTYHTTTGRQDENGIYLKLAGDIKLKIYKNYIGLLIKFGISKTGYGGIGLFFGFNSRDFKK